MFQEGTHIVRATVLEIQIIGMLPDIHGQDRGFAIDQRCAGIRGFFNLQLAAIQHQPGPAGPELCCASIFELGCEFFIRPEIFVDLVSNRTGWLAAAIGAH